MEMTICMQQNILHLTGRTQTGPITTSKYKHAMDTMIQFMFNVLNRNKSLIFCTYFQNSADQARNNSESIRNEGFRLIAEREDTTVKKQRDSDKRVGERLNDVSHWRSELQVMKLTVGEYFSFLRIIKFIALFASMFCTLFSIFSFRLSWKEIFRKVET